MKEIFSSLPPRLNRLAYDLCNRPTPFDKEWKDLIAFQRHPGTDEEYLVLRKQYEEERDKRQASYSEKIENMLKRTKIVSSLYQLSLLLEAQQLPEERRMVRGMVLGLIENPGRNISEFAQHSIEL